jgi:hypothetical protein
MLINGYIWISMFRQSTWNNLGPQLFYLDHLSCIHVVYYNKIDQTF